jgi:hypothetical protein
MKYQYTKPTKAKHIVSFYQSNHPELIESGSCHGVWNLTQEVKSWLATNNIKVFVDYDSGKWGEEPLTVIIEFQTEDDAMHFIETWNKNGRI